MGYFKGRIGPDSVNNSIDHLTDLERALTAQNQALVSKLKPDRALRPILLSIIFHALMGRFQLELFICIIYFYTVIPLPSCVFFPVGLSSLTRHFQQVL